MKRRTYQEWMDLYAVDHQNRWNQLLHTLCVPAILFSLTGLLWALSEPLAWAVLAMGLAFYFTLGWKHGLKMFLVFALVLGGNAMVESWRICAVVFVIAWFGQFWGHHLERRKPSFMTDLIFLLIGPLWVLRKLTPKSC